MQDTASPVYIIPVDGIYMLTIYINNDLESDKSKVFTAHGNIEMMGSYGYLSAVDWPLLPVSS